MPNSFNTILNVLKTACSSSSVATLAGVPSDTWANYHVFIGNGHKQCGRNRGRKGYISITKGREERLHETTDGDGPGGTLTQTWFIDIFFFNPVKPQETIESTMYDIATEILKATNVSLISDHRINTMNYSDIGMTLRLEFDTVLSWDLKESI